MDTLKRLGGPTTYANTTANTIYTVPASTTAVIRTIMACNNALTQPGFIIGIGGVAVGNMLFNVNPLAIGETFEWTGFIVMAAAETLQVSNSIASNVTFSIFGIEVT